MSELTANEATALMAAGMYASPPTEAQMKGGIERAESWLAAHDREVVKEFLLRYHRPSVRIENPEDILPFLAAHDRQVEAEAVRQVAEDMFWDGDRDSATSAEYYLLLDRADRIESQETP